MRMKQAVMWTGVLGCLVTAMWLWWGDAFRIEGANEARGANSQQGPSADASPPASIDHSKGSDTPPSPPRPPTGTPLPALWPSLEAAARAGHAPSACRLGIETLRCSTFQSLGGSHPPPRTLPSNPLAALEAFVNDPTSLSAEISAPAFDAPGMRERIDRMDAEIDRLCGNPSPKQTSDALAFLRQAALAGVPDAQTVYATAGGTLQMIPGAMADPVFERWIEEAPTVLARMLEAGHPDAPGLLSEAYARDQFHGYLFPYDPVRSLAFAQLDRRIGNERSFASRMLDHRRSALSPAQRAEADQLADQLFDAHYAGRVLRRDADRRRMLDTIAVPGTSAAGQRDTECAAAITGGDEP